MNNLEEISKNIQKSFKDIKRYSPTEKDIIEASKLIASSGLSASEFNELFKAE